MAPYRVPLLSQLARAVAYALPSRVRAWVWIVAYDNLDQHMSPVNHHSDDGSVGHFDAISAVGVEKLRRRLYREHLRATPEEKW